MRFARLLRLALLMLGLAVAGLALASPAAASTAASHHAPSTVKLSGGSTSLKVDAGTAGVLTKNHVSVTAIAGAKGKAPSFSFPVTGGKVNPKTAAGTVSHRGGLRFAAGKTTLGVQDFVIDTTKGVLTARVSGTSTRIPLLKLDTSKAKISAKDCTLTVSNVRVTLTAQAAAALNKTFKVKLFTAGLPIGTTKTVATY